MARSETLRLLRLEVKGYRGIRESSVWLGQHSVLLGENGVGKSSLVDALALLVGRGRLSSTLSDHDFHGGYPNAASRIQVRGLFGAFEPDSISDQPLWFGPNGGIPQWLNEGTGTVQPQKDDLHDHLCLEIAYCARFVPETLEYEAIRYFVDGDVDPFADEEVRRLSSRQLAEIGFLLLPSSRTWERTLTFASELFRRTLSAHSGMPASELMNLRDQLLKLPADLETDEGFADLMNKFRSELASFIGADESRLRLQMTRGDIASVLEAMTMGISTRSGFRVPVSQAGSGVRAFQTLILLLELGRSRIEAGKGFLLAAEEPELHLNPGLHRKLVGRIRAAATQSVVTTHSPEIAGYYRPEEILFLSMDEGKLAATPMLSEGQGIPSENALMRLFTIHRSEVCHALMGRVALIPEGETEHRWFHALLRALTSVEGAEIPEEVNTLGIVPTQSASVVRTYEHLSKLHESCIPLVDGDTAGQSYINAFKNLDIPPALVIQLGSEQELEDLLAWIMRGDGTIDLSPVDISTGETGVPDRLYLAEVLKSPEYKQRWDVHEQLAWAIATSSGARDRAAGFLADLIALPAGKKPKLGIWTQLPRENGTPALWRATFGH